VICHERSGGVEHSIASSLLQELMEVPSIALAGLCLATGESCGDDWTWTGWLSRRWDRAVEQCITAKKKGAGTGALGTMIWGFRLFGSGFSFHHQKIYSLHPANNYHWSGQLFRRYFFFFYFHRGTLLDLFLCDMWERWCESQPFFRETVRNCLDWRIFL